MAGDLVATVRPLAAIADGQLHSVAIDPMDLGASCRRHPSSLLDGAPQATAACPTCGFDPPTCGETAEALRALPNTWRRAIDSGDPAHVDAVARLRDELHAVANRVARVLVDPGTSLSRVHIDAPSALSGALDTDLLIARLQVSAARIADLIDTIEPHQWQLSGRIGSSVVTVAELVRMPLHASHRRIRSRAVGQQASVIILDDHRTRTLRGRSTRDARVGRAATAMDENDSPQLKDRTLDSSKTAPRHRVGQPEALERRPASPIGALEPVAATLAQPQGASISRDLGRQLRRIAGEVDDLWRDSLQGQDFDLVWRSSEASHAVHRALLALEDDGLTIG